MHHGRVDGLPPVTERRTAIFYDTYRSYRDRLPEGGRLFRLFCGHGLEQSGEPVTNLIGAPGMLPGDQALRVDHIGVRLETSSAEFREELLRNMTIELEISGKNAFDIDCSLLKDGVGGATLAEEHEADPFKEGQAVFVKLDREIAIPPRQQFHITINFGGMAHIMDRVFHERGPGARWVKVRGYLIGEHSRQVL